MNALFHSYVPGSGTFNAGDLQVGSDQTTDASGHYLFSNLDAGKYVVDFSDAISKGYLLTKQNQGSSDAADSDAVAATTIV